VFRLRPVSVILVGSVPVAISEIVPYPIIATRPTTVELVLEIKLAYVTAASQNLTALEPVLRAINQTITAPPRITARVYRAII